MYFALKYFYEIKKGDVSKSENGIGIIPHIYEDSRDYWVEREHREQGIVAAIEHQIKEAQNQRVIDVQRTLEMPDDSIPILHCPDYAK